MTALSQKARELAALIDKATPGPWSGRLLIEITAEDSDACDAARNDAPALLRALADENERLRQTLTLISAHAFDRSTAIDAATYMRDLATQSLKGPQE